MAQSSEESEPMHTDEIHTLISITLICAAKHKTEHDFTFTKLAVEPNCSRFDLLVCSEVPVKCFDNDLMEGRWC